MFRTYLPSEPDHDASTIAHGRGVQARGSFIWMAKGSYAYSMELQ